MKYYCQTCYKNGETRREVVEYDEKNGIRKYPEYTIINHGSLVVNRVYDSPRDALQAWGEWSEIYVKMPGGRIIRPIDIFHPDYALTTVFIPWQDVYGEVYP